MCGAEHRDNFIYFYLSTANFVNFYRMVTEDLKPELRGCQPDFKYLFIGFTVCYCDIHPRGPYVNSDTQFIKVTEMWHHL
jgi:hypothetical protein